MVVAKKEIPVFVESVVSKVKFAIEDSQTDSNFVAEGMLRIVMLVGSVVVLEEVQMDFRLESVEMSVAAAYS